MSKVYFTSDLHFGHEKLLTMGKGRPFKTIQEHDKTIIDNWNKKVEAGSDVYILGDIFFKGYTEQDMERVFQSLHGRKHIILGNHDKKNPLLRLKERGIIQTVEDYYERELKTSDGRKIFLVLCHFPILEFNRAYKNDSIMLYGHIHNIANYNNIYGMLGFRAYHVGVDTNNFTPVSLDEIVRRFWKYENN